MTEDTLYHLRAIKNEVNKLNELVKTIVETNTKQADIITKLEDTTVEQANKIKNLEVEIQILKDGGNI